MITLYIGLSSYDVLMASKFLGPSVDWLHVGGTKAKTEVKTLQKNGNQLFMTLVNKLEI